MVGVYFVLDFVSRGERIRRGEQSYPSIFNSASPDSWNKDLHLARRAPFNIRSEVGKGGNWPTAIKSYVTEELHLGTEVPPTLPYPCLCFFYSYGPAAKAT